MGRRPSLDDQEKQNITKLLGNGKNALEIAKHLKKDARTIKNAIQNINFTRKTRCNKGKCAFSKRELRKIAKAAKKMPVNSSKAIFEETGVEDVSRDTRCRILRTMGKVVKVKARPPLSEKHMCNRVSWAKKYLKLEFSKFLFTDKYRATLDGPGGWFRGWFVEGQRAPLRYRRQQRGEGILFWAAIVGETLVE